MSEAMAWVDAAVPSPVSIDEAQEESLRFSAVVGEIYAMANESDGLGRATRAIAALLAADRAELIASSAEEGDLVSRQEVVIRRTSRHQLLDAKIRNGSPSLRLRVGRDRQWPRFDEGEVRIVRMLVPHLRRAIELREQLAARRSSSIEFELELLSKLGVAVAVVDGSLSLLCSNETARQVLAAEDGILVEKQQLFASSAASTVRLRNAVQNVIDGVSSLSTVVVDRMIADTPLHVTIVGAHTGGRALLVIAGGGQPPANMPRILNDAYGLSPAEGRLVQLLVEGRSAIEAAAILGVSPNTARTQLKSVLRKTTTRRQSELVSVLLRGALRFT